MGSQDFHHCLEGMFLPPQVSVEVGQGTLRASRGSPPIPSQGALSVGLVHTQNSTTCNQL